MRLCRRHCPACEPVGGAEDPCGLWWSAEEAKAIIPGGESSATPSPAISLGAYLHAASKRREPCLRETAEDAEHWLSAGAIREARSWSMFEAEDTTSWWRAATYGGRPPAQIEAAAIFIVTTSSAWRGRHARSCCLSGGWRALRANALVLDNRGRGLPVRWGGDWRKGRRGQGSACLMRQCDIIGRLCDGAPLARLMTWSCTYHRCDRRAIRRRKRARGLTHV